MFRLYLDEDSMDLDLARGLRRNGIDVTTAAEAGNLRAPDDEQLRFATSMGRAIYTANNADFSRLHAACLDQGIDHAGIIVRTSQRMPIGEQLRGLSRLAAEWPDGLPDTLVYLSRSVPNPSP